MGRTGLAYHEEMARAVHNLVLLSLFAAFSRSNKAGLDLTTEQPFKSRTEVRQQGAVTVRAAVLTDDESERYFGASLADHGIQVDLAKRR